MIHRHSTSIVSSRSRVRASRVVAVPAFVAFPTFDDPAKPFVFRAGDPSVSGPFGILQPPRKAPKVEPDLILVPLIAVDRRGTRVGRGKGHYDRALARLRRGGARLVGVGWDLQLLETTIPAPRCCWPTN